MQEENNVENEENVDNPLSEDNVARLLEGLSVGVPRKRRTKETKIRELRDCFVPGYSKDIKENDYILSWQSPEYSKEQRGLLGVTEIGAIKSASGVGKSTCLRAIYSAVFEQTMIDRGVSKEDRVKYNLGFKFHHPGVPHTIVHLDTEQSQSLCYKRNRTIYEVVSGNPNKRPSNFFPFYLKGIPMDWKLKHLEDFCIGMRDAGKPVKLVTIDHVGDFVNDYNSERQAIDLFYELDELATTYGFSILYVIHTNSTSRKQNGHLGSQGNRRNVMECYLYEDDDDPSFVRIEFDKLRDAPKDFEILARRGWKGTFEYETSFIRKYDTRNDGQGEQDGLPSDGPHQDFEAQRMQLESGTLDAFFDDIENKKEAENAFD